MSLRRSVSSLLATFMALAFMLLLAPTVAHAATLDTASEAAFVSDLNRERTSRGIAALSSVADLVEVARQQSVRMASQNLLYHNPNLVTDVVGWLSVGENVGYGGSESAIHSAFMNSPPHTANILSSTYTQVGIGAVRDGSGRLWVTQVFRKPNSTTISLPTISPLPLNNPLPAPSSGWQAPPVSTPGVGSGGGALWIAERAGNGSVGVRAVMDGIGISNLIPLGGGTTDMPALAAEARGALSVFVRGTDQQVWMRKSPTNVTSWSTWESLGGAVTARPAAASWGPDRVDVVARGTDGSLWHRFSSSPGRWSNWTSLGGVMAAGSGPALTAAGSERLTVVVKGTDGQAWHRSYAPGGWSAWMPLGGMVVGEPTASSPSPGRVVVAVKGTDSAAWALNLDDLRASNWTRVGGILSGSPVAAATVGSGVLDLLTLGTDGGLHRALQVGGSWQPWRRLY